MNCDNNKARRQVGVSIRAISNWIWFHSSRMFWRNECLNEMETNSDWNWARMKRGLKGMEKINLNCWFELIWIHAAHSSRPSLIFAFFNSMLRRKLKRCRASVCGISLLLFNLISLVLFPACLKLALIAAFISTFIHFNPARLIEWSWMKRTQQQLN